ncbi:DUF805 domain-containing protein [Falsiruegeria mediterranea]|uniref:Inner membrane protein YhaH n=1 Tax=Falsiruegeria mediterranea M17 TaxID=1200281 RepID=A0A2R8C728_9RHOB|nr:DUF805 domain-containing protein [Falsiruegeria mediterranea]SPJ28240.1 Inner membrane protein YhaH [Falsiruegeria mediterranea M17]
MGFVDAIKTCLAKYFVFSGRALRSEYWWFVLFVVIVSIALAIVDASLFGMNPETGESNQVITPIFQLAVVIPMLAAGWRRLHDTGRPGWYLLLPAALSIATMFMVFSGVAVFSVLEQGADDPDALRGPAALLGTTGLMVVGVVQLILSVLMIWWLSRPSEEGANDYGPPAV